MPSKRPRKHKSSVYLEPDVKQQLRLAASQMHISEAQFIREAIDMKLAEATAESMQSWYDGLVAITGMVATDLRDVSVARLAEPTAANHKDGS